MQHQSVTTASAPSGRRDISRDKLKAPALKVPEAKSRPPTKEQSVFGFTA